MDKLLFFTMILLFGCITPSPVQNEDGSLQSWPTTTPRASCVEVTESGVYEAGEFDNGVGIPSMTFCITGSCGAEIVFRTINVVDFLSFTSNGQTSGRIGVGGKGYGGQFIDLQPGETEESPFSGFSEKVYYGPIEVEITPTTITVTKMDSGDDGDMYVDVKLENAQVLVESNKHKSTVWYIDIKPKHFCVNYKELLFAVACPNDTVYLVNPCPDVDFDVIWTSPTGKLIGNGDTLVLPPPVEIGFYEWETPCHRGKYAVLHPDSVRISVTPILCSKLSRLSVPYGLKVKWPDGNYSNSIVVGEGVYWAEYSEGCNFTLDTVFVDGTLHDFDLKITIEPDFDTIILTAQTIFASKSNKTGTKFTWYQNGNQVQKVFGAGTYVLEGRYDNCTAYDTIAILTEPLACRYHIYKPNIFSPNDDGVEDVFYLSPPDGGEVLLFRIYDRWGGLVYEGINLDPQKGWDGKINGKPANPEVFTWYAIVLYNNSQCFVSGSTVPTR